MSEEDLGIKYYFNKTASKSEFEIKDTPEDFIVQEITTEGIVCTETDIFDIVKYINSIDFLIFLSDDNTNEQAICKYFEGGDIHSDEDIYEKINNQNMGNTTNFDLSNTEIRSYETLMALVSAKFKCLKEKYKSITLRKIPIKSKEVRNKVHSMLNYIPNIDTKTIDEKVTIEKSEINTFRFTLKKVMLNTIDACKMIENALGSSVSFAGNKDKKATTYQEVSMKCSFNELINFVYLNNATTKKDIVNIVIYNYIEGISNSQIDQEVIDEELKKGHDQYKDYLVGAINTSRSNLELDQLTTSIANSSLPKEYYKSAISIYNIRKGHNKKLGDLKGNRFNIRIKDKNDLPYTNLENGFINYFGLQRFGKNKNNHKVGEYILNKEYTKAIELIMKNSRGYEDYLKGDLEECLRKCDNIERYLFKNKGKMSDKNIIMKMRREIRMLYLHSHQSYIFNEDVNEVIAKMCGHNINDSVGESKLEQIDKINNTDYIKEISEIILDLRKMNDKMLKGGQRKIIEKAYDVKGYNAGNDFVISFSLNSSCYATMALREL